MKKGQLGSIYIDHLTQAWMEKNQVAMATSIATCLVRTISIDLNFSLVQITSFKPLERNKFSYCPTNDPSTSFFKVTF